MSGDLFTRDVRILQYRESGGRYEVSGISFDSSVGYQIYDQFLTLKSAIRIMASFSTLQPSYLMKT